MSTATDTRLEALEARIAEIDDRRAILDTLYRYAHCIDAGLADDWADCFTDDAVYERAGKLRPGEETPMRGRADLVKFAEGVKAGARTQSRHFIVDPVVTFD